MSVTTAAPAAPSAARPGAAAADRGARSWVVDALATAALLACGTVGFERAYGGTGYLVAGLAGIALGLLVAVVSDRLRAPFLATAAVTVVVFFLLGGPIAVRDGAAALPTRGTLGRLADGATSGWLDLLTVLPPVGTSGNLLTIPYLLGLLGAVTSFALARRTARVWPPLLPGAVVLALSILFGTDEPASEVLQGMVFAVVALAWVAVRADAGVRAAGRAGALRRLAGAVVVLALAAGGAALGGPRLPWTTGHDRVVLRDHVDPPFDPRSYVSPLAGFRRYVLKRTPKHKNYLGDRVLLTATGVPEGALLRLATMDDYDGSVWNVAGGAAPTSGLGAGGSGWFQKVGETIPTATRGERVDVTVSVGDLDGVWMPTLGDVTRVGFAGPDAAELRETFRYNLATGSAVTGTRPATGSRGLRTGDTYTFTAVLPPTQYLQPKVEPATLNAAPAMTVGQPDVTVKVEAITSRTAEVIGDATGPWAKAQAIAETLRAGQYSDGEAQQPVSDPGHGAARLLDMLGTPDALVGDAEQYAALMALMAREAGLPARVVVGAAAPKGAGARWEVTGRDVTAWVEIGLDGVGWVPVMPTPEQRITKPKPIPERKLPKVDEPPRDPVPPSLDVDALASGKTTPTTPVAPPRRPLPRWVYVAGASVGAPVLLLLGSLTGVVLLKRRRRRRRRTRGAPATRVDGGWREVVDLARDTGAQVPARATRSEVAQQLAAPSVVLLADRADGVVFGPDEPTDADVASFWAQVETARRELTHGLGRWARFRAAVTTRSLRGL